MLNRKSLPVVTCVLYSCQTDKEYTHQDVVTNYYSRNKQIDLLKSYYNSLVPSGKFVEIEFDNNEHLFRFGVYPLDSLSHKIVTSGFLEWDLNTNSKKVDSVITTLGWNQRNLNLIKQKLDSANCISIESGEPCKIGFQRRGFGKYYYLVYDKPMTDSLRNFYKIYCPYRVYDDKTILMWGSGAIGSDCYPKY